MDKTRAIPTAVLAEFNHQLHNRGAMDAGKPGGGSESMDFNCFSRRGHSKSAFALAADRRRMVLSRSILWLNRPRCRPETYFRSIPGLFVGIEYSVLPSAVIVQTFKCPIKRLEKYFFVCTIET